MKIHLKIRCQQLMTANAMQRKLERGFVLRVVSVNVMLEVADIVDRLGAVETFARNHLAVLEFVFS